jgi:hypothetical protein
MIVVKYYRSREKKIKSTFIQYILWSKAEVTIIIVRNDEREEKYSRSHL